MERSYDIEPGAILTQDIGIAGMTCEHCVRRVDKALRNKTGVKEVKVDLQSARATVTFDPRQTNLPDLHETLLRAGYKPAPSQ